MSNVFKRNRRIPKYFCPKRKNRPYSFSGNDNGLFFSSGNRITLLITLPAIHIEIVFQINLGDGLPEVICTACAEKAVELYLFKQCCERSDQVLRNRLRKSREKEDRNDECVDLNSVIIIKNEFIGEDERACDAVDRSSDDSEAEHKRDSNSSLQSEESHLSKDHKCDMCQKTFVREENLIKHKILHAVHKAPPKEQTQQVNIAPVNNPEPLQQENQTSNVVQRPFTCHICEAKFAKHTHLSFHLKIHSSTKQHSCKVCGKRFARAEQLTNHANTHSGLKPHVCKICSKGFNQISNLKDHMRTHNGERPFLCSTCGKGFNQLGNLRQHTIRHSGIKAHLCNICGNGFASKGELCAHLRKHTGKI